MLENMFEKRFLFQSGILIIFMITASLLASLLLNDWHFTYALDDAYIHLSIAENIAVGHYGINTGEFSAAASSIIWPIILAPFTLLHCAEIFPLLLNSIFALFTVILSSRILIVVFKDIQESANKLYLLLLIQFMFILGCNLVGLVLTGMEHSLQVLVTVLIIYGLIKIVENEKVSPVLLLSIIVAPLVRYENTVLSLLAIIFLFLQKEYVKSFITLILIIGLLGGFSIFLMSLGLSAMPTSISTKSASVGSNSGFLTSVIQNFIENIFETRGVFLLLLLLPAFAKLFSDSNSFNQRYIVFIAITVTFAHLFGGKLLYWDRYYPYVVAVSVLSGIYVYSQNITKLYTRIGEKNLKFKLSVILILLTALLFPYQIKTFLLTPVACNNIYSQQYQMHKFITDYYDKPVAVNDIGYPSWRNDNHILDYAGLSYAESNEYYMKEESRVWMDRAAKKYNVEMVLIYDKYFPYLPPNWVKVGRFYFDGLNVVCGDREVSIYAINHNEQEIRNLILQAKYDGIPGVDVVE